MSTSVPAVVRRRKTFAYLGDAGTILMLLGAAVRFVQHDAALAVWFVGVVTAVVGTILLRRSVRSQDQRPDEELDEYELLRRFRAQRSGYRMALAFLMVTWFIFGWLTLFRNSGPESFDTLIDALYAALYLTSALMVGVPLAVLRNIAGGMNKDILISGSDDEVQDKVTAQ